LSREILLKLFEKYHLNLETCNICLRSAPTLPLSLDQPVKHLLLDDLVVTGIYKKLKNWLYNFFLFSFLFPFFLLIKAQTSFVCFFLLKTTWCIHSKYPYIFIVWCNISRHLNVPLLLLFIDVYKVSINLIYISINKNEKNRTWNNVSIMRIQNLVKSKKENLTIINLIVIVVVVVIVTFPSWWCYIISYSLSIEHIWMCIYNFSSSTIVIVTPPAYILSHLL